MGPLTCRLLPYAIADGPANMAADEALLATAVAGRASLRFYGWATATVSLGYFQPERVRREDALLAPLPYVRRPSGGATLVHHHEITYALALPPGPPWQSEYAGPHWLRRMHGIIALALGDLGVAARAHALTPGQEFPGFLCFHHFAAGDLLIGEAKVVGSAQRRQRGALLQHGAILLAQSPFTPALPGIRELTGKYLHPEEVSAAVVGQYKRQTGWEIEPGAWTAAEQEFAATRAAAKYRSAAWSEKR